MALDETKGINAEWIQKVGRVPSDEELEAVLNESLSAAERKSAQAEILVRAQNGGVQLTRTWGPDNGKKCPNGGRTTPGMAFKV